MGSGALLAAVVEQAPAGVLPRDLLAVQPLGVGGLDLESAIAAAAGDPQDGPPDVGEL